MKTYGTLFERLRIIRIPALESYIADIQYIIHAEIFCEREHLILMQIAFGFGILLLNGGIRFVFAERNNKRIPLVRNDGIA